MRMGRGGELGGAGMQVGGGWGVGDAANSFLCPGEADLGVSGCSQAKLARAWWADVHSQSLGLRRWSAGWREVGLAVPWAPGVKGQRGPARRRLVSPEVQRRWRDGAGILAPRGKEEQGRAAAGLVPGEVGRLATVAAARVSGSARHYLGDSEFRPRSCCDSGLPAWHRGLLSSQQRHAPVGQRSAGQQVARTPHTAPPP